MTNRLADLHQRRGRLLERIAHQRDTLATAVEPVRDVLDATDFRIDQFRAGVAWLRRNPVVVAGAVAALVVFRGRGLLRWGRRAFLAWQTWRSVRERMLAAAWRPYR